MSLYITQASLCRSSLFLPPVRQLYLCISLLALVGLGAEILRGWPPNLCNLLPKLVTGFDG